MSLIMALLVFAMFTSGLYLMMKRHMVEVLLGVLLVSHGTNLLLLAQGGWLADRQPPLVLADRMESVDLYVDPLPQALILTAIVIGFGVAAFLVVLMARGIEETDSTEMGELGREENEA